MREIVIDPDDLVYEIYVMGGDLFIEQSMKIPLEALMTATELPNARLRVVVGGERRGTIDGGQRSSYYED